MEDLNPGAQRPDRKPGDTRGDDTPTVTGPVAAGNGAREATGVSSGNGSSAHGPDVNSRHRHPVSGPDAAPEPVGAGTVADPSDTGANSGSAQAVGGDLSPAPTLPGSLPSCPSHVGSTAADPIGADAVAGAGVVSVFSGVAGLAGVSAVLRGLVDELGVVGVGAPRRDILDAALEVEALSRVVGSVQVRLAGLLESEHVASSPRGGSYGWEDEPLRPEYKSTKDLMVNTLHIRGRDAANRLALAEVTAPRVHMDGSPRDAKEPELAKLVAAGEVGIDGAVVIHEAVKSIRSHRSVVPAFEGESSGVDVDELAVAAEQHLCELASGFGPEFLRRVGQHYEAIADQDGAEPSERYLAVHQGLFYLGRQGKLHVLKAVLTQEQYEALATTLNAFLTHPRTSADTGTGASTGTGAGASAGAGAGVGVDTPVGQVLAMLGVEPSGRQVERSRQGWEATYPQKLLDILIATARHGGLALTDPPTKPRTNTSPSSKNGGIGPAAAEHGESAPDEMADGALAHPAGADGPEPAAPPRPATADSAADVSAGPGPEPGPVSGDGGLDSRVMVRSQQTLIAIIDQNDLTGALESAHGVGFLERTGPIPASRLRKMACEANIIPVVMGGNGQPLDVGRAKRLFTPAQRAGLYARDRGCIFPNCTTPMSLCEAHHLNPWSAGGATNLDNGVLLCSYHHHLIHREHWKIIITNHTPWLIPPPWTDPAQHPVRNQLHHNPTTTPPPPPTPRQ